MEFPSLEAAYPEARHTVPEMGAELVRMTVNSARQAFQISDDSDAFLIEVPFSEILDRGHRPVPPFRAAQAAAAVQLARSADLIDALRRGARGHARHGRRSLTGPRPSWRTSRLANPRPDRPRCGGPSRA